jgi:molecular chaperone IbpA
MSIIANKFGYTGLKDFDKFFVGFDDQFSRLSKLHDDMTKNIPNYPPYNIKKTGENTYVIEIAVAGFSRQEIELELDGDKLYVKGNAADETATNPFEFLYRGIANRSFTRTFALNDQVEVKNAAMVNGMLRIILERVIPEHNKPKRIDISDEPSTVSDFTGSNVYRSGEQVFGPGSK